MSNKPDKRVSVKLSEESTAMLKEVQEHMLASYGLHIPIPSLANTAIANGVMRLRPGGEGWMGKKP